MTELSSPINFRLPDSIIASYVHNHMVENPSKQESRTESIYRLRIKGASWLLAIIGQIPFYKIAGRIAGNNIAYRSILIYGNLATISAFYAWATGSAGEDMLLPYTEEERSLLVDKLPVVLKVAISISGMVAQTPLAYPSYVYNGRNLSYPIIVYLCHPGPTIYSLLLSAKHLMRSFSLKSDQDKIILKLRQAFIQSLKSSYQSLLQLGVEERSMFLSELRTITSSSELPPHEAVEQYISQLLTHKISQEEISKASKLSALIVGTTLTTAQYWLFYKIGIFLGADISGKDTPDNRAWEVIMGSAMVAFNAYLLAQGTIGSVQRVFNRMASFWNGNRSQSYAHSLSPKLTIGCQLLSLGTVAVSYGSNVFFARTYFNKNWEVHTQEILLPISVIFLVLGALESIINDLVETTLGSNESAQEAIRFNHKYTRFIRLLERSPLVEFARFMSILSDDVIAEYLNQVELTRVQLQEYITDHTTEADSLLDHSQ